MTEALLVSRDLAIGYHGKHPRRVAEGIALDLWPGELVCLLGPNGAGKSTLLRTLAGMQRPLRGSIHLLGADLRRLQPRDLARRLSVVLTDRMDVGALSAYGLVALGRYPHTDWTGRPGPADEAATRQALEAVGAHPLASRQVNELSDGERQKVMIARALAQEPAIMLLDEPTAFLDLPGRVEIISILRRLAQEAGRAVVLSTHDLDLALRVADRLWLLSLNGALVAGAPEDLVLNGAFGAAFHNQGVEFDLFSGSFKMHRSQMGRVELVGDGLPVLWTERALEREGFSFNGDGPASIRIQAPDGQVRTAWRISRRGEEQKRQTLYDTLVLVKAWTAEEAALASDDGPSRR